MYQFLGGKKEKKILMEKYNNNKVDWDWPEWKDIYNP